MPQAKLAKVSSTKKVTELKKGKKLMCYQGQCQVHYKYYTWLRRLAKNAQVFQNLSKCWTPLKL